MLFHLMEINKDALLKNSRRFSFCVSLSARPLSFWKCTAPVVVTAHRNGVPAFGCHTNGPRWLAARMFVSQSEKTPIAHSNVHSWCHYSLVMWPLRPFTAHMWTNAQTFNRSDSKQGLLLSPSVVTSDIFHQSVTEHSMLCRGQCVVKMDDELPSAGIEPSTT